MTIEEMDNNNYRFYRMKDGFSFEQLTERDLAYYKTVNNFQDDDRLVVLEGSDIVFIED